MTDAKAPRFPLLKFEELSDAQRPLAEDILKMSSIALGGPYNPTLRSPGFLEHFLKMARYLRFATSIPFALNEFAIIIVARRWRSQVEWFAHAPLAIKAGLSPSIVDAVKRNERPSGMNAEETMVYDFTTEITGQRKVSDETFARMKTLFSEQQIVDLTAVVGFYEMVAMMLAMADQNVPDGKEPPFKPGEP